MSRVKHRNDQATRTLKAPRGLPGENMGLHAPGRPGLAASCNCGGCKDGKRLQAMPKVVTL